MDAEWSLRPGFLVHQKIIYGDKKIVKRFKREVKKMEEKDLKKGTKELNVQMYEYLGKIKNANKNKSREEMMVSLTFYTIQANLLVGLINEHIYKRQDFRALQEARKFKKLPKNYYRLMNVLYNSTDLEKITKAAIKLYNNCVAFLKLQK